MTQRQRETLRRSFRPARVRVLFVGESPPASGRFFYRGDSGFYRATRAAFTAVDPSIDETSFLAAFRDSGSYLVDLCAEPVDALDREARRAQCRSGETSLSRTLARLRPSVIVTVVRSIENNVTRAASRANWRGTLIHLPYPGRWARSRTIFVKTLAESIRSLERRPGRRQ